MNEYRTKRVFFISECLVNQNIRAYGVKNISGQGPVSEILNELSSHGIGITVIPCPEIAYEGLKRNACGKTCYRNDAYRSLCDQQAGDFINRYKLYLDDEYQVGGFICINGSPSCAIDYCFDGIDGTIRCSEAGVFIEAIQKQLQQAKLSLEFIGYHKKNLAGVLERIRNIAKQMEEKNHVQDKT